MNTAAFTLLAVFLGAYVVLDGYDLGVGAMHLLLPRSDDERATSLATIGPFWNGNEVWIIAAGGVLFALFPQAYAAAFSGFYLPLTIGLWLLMGRGMALELRGHFANDLWHDFWDVTFAACSTMLALVFGVALGNVVRGVPLDSNGYFTGTFASLLNWYAILVGLFALGALALHGLTFAAWRSAVLATDHAQRLLQYLWIAVLALFAATTWATLRVHPPTIGPILWMAPAAALCALFTVRFARNRALRFAASSVFLAALMIAAAATIYPYVLPSYPVGSGGLTIYDASAGVHGLFAGTVVFAIGFCIVAVYGTLSARSMLRKSDSLDGPSTGAG